MNVDQAIDVVKNLMILCLKMSLPLLLSAMIIGLLVSFFQAITSIQEQTLTFVPKAMFMVVIFVVLFPWMTNTMLDYTSEMFRAMSEMAP